MPATFSKPTKVPRWADTGVILEPSEAKKDAGWVFGEEPASNFENWKENTTGSWFKWINERLFDGASANIFVIKNPNDATEQLKTLTAGGIEVVSGLNVGFAGVSAAAQVRVGDTVFGIRFNAGVAPDVFFDTNDTFGFNRAANRFEWSTASVQRAALTSAGLNLGSEVPTYPFTIGSSITGTLGAVATNSLNISLINYLNGADTTQEHRYGYRHSAGATDATQSTYIHRLHGATYQGFVRFAGASVTTGILAHVGIGSGVQGAAPAVFVDDLTLYVRDKDFWLSFSAGNPRITFSSANDRVDFNRTTGRMALVATGPIQLPTIAAPAGLAGDVFFNTLTGNLEGHNGTQFHRYVPQVFALTTPQTLIAVGAFTGTYTVPANTLRAGSTIRARFYGFYDQAAAAGSNVTLEFRIGGVIAASFLIAYDTDAFLFGEVNVTIATTGAGGTFNSGGVVSLTASTPFTSAVLAGAIDTTAAKVLDLNISTYVNMTGIALYGFQIDIT